MSSAAIWRGDVLASTLSSAKAGQSGNLLREATIDSRLDALKNVAQTLLDAVDSLRTAQPSREQSVSLQDEVQRFESDLIRTALERTGGNQARAARLLGVKHTTLNAKIKRYRIRCDGFGVEPDKNAGDREIAA
jgi:transcriptional regulator with GAF, ATPase, and Fis domain